MTSNPNPPADPSTPRLRLATPMAAPRRQAATPDTAGFPGRLPSSPRDPMLVVSLRAFALDAFLLSVGMALFVTVMVAQEALYNQRATYLVATAIVVWWLLLLVVRGAYEARFLGVGSEEFKRLVTATATLLALIAITAYFVSVAPPVRMVLPALALGLLTLMIGRWLLRIWLGKQREAGRYQVSTLIVGEKSLAGELAKAFAADPVAGFQVVGIVAPPPARGEQDFLAEWLADLTAWVQRHNVAAVAVAESPSIAPELLRQLAWALEGPRVDLLVSPALSDVAGPRVSVRPAAGLPLLHLDEPSLTGSKRALKRALDLALALPAVVLLTPVWLLIALAIKLDSPGSVFYRQQRVGRSGELFTCLKFRSMQTGADRQRETIIGDPDEQISARYRHDPRITNVGAFLRRWSLDELPQLFNVIVSNMSLVGPRPMLLDEMRLLGAGEHRRHLTKPGMTGLWQISGRKEVSWEDRMRLDLHYVETWSMALDMVIIAKTVKAVLTGKGAY
ncbi:MAG: sugar transferase [Candidatus Nanopelagicales bacterium]